MEAGDKLIDKHFHKVPDAALHAHNYHPRNLSSLRNSKTDPDKSKRRDSKTTDPGSETDQSPRMMAQSDAGSQYAMPPQYSHEPPKLRPQYMPSPPPIGGGYYPPPASSGPPYSAVDRRSRRDDDSYYSDSYRSAPRRPRAITRRSSSYHGPKSRNYESDSDSSDDGKQIIRRRRDSMSTSQRTRDHDHDHRHGWKDEVEKNFTKSPDGITGSVVGAVVGGWAAKKAQTASGKNKHGKGSSTAVTVLGAALGGLAVNAIIDKWEDRNEKTEEKQEKWEDKFARQDESDYDSDDGKSRSSRRNRDRRDRRDSRDSRDDRSRDDRSGRSYYD